MLKHLVEKVDNVDEKMENYGRETETIRKAPMETWVIINMLSEVKNSLTGPSVELTALRKRLSEHEDRPMESIQYETQKEKIKVSKTVRQYQAG